MASPQYNKQHRPNESFGQKVKHVSETLAGMKSIYETGKMVYSGIQTAAPYIASGMALL